MGEAGWNSLFALGMNHRTAPVELREKIALPPEARVEVRKALLGEDRVAGSVLLSTCNRTELYGCHGEQGGSKDSLLEILHPLILPAVDAPGHAYVHWGWDSVFHLFRVAAGLDSMVVGESEILRQVKLAQEEAHSAGQANRLLQDLFRQAVELGKKVRRETHLGDGSLSVAATAVKLARKIVGELKGRKALVVGAGETGRLTAKHLLAAGVEDLVLLNRTPEKAEEAAGELGCRHGALDDLEAAIDEAEVIMAAVEAEDFVVRPEHFKGRRRRRRCVIDISMPRSVDPSCTQVSGVFLFDLDDLGGLVEQARRARRGSVREAESLLLNEVQKFLSRQSYVEISPIVNELRGDWHDVVEEGLDRLPLDAKGRSEVERLVKKVMGMGLDALKRSQRQRFGMDEIQAAYDAYLKRIGEA